VTVETVSGRIVVRVVAGSKRVIFSRDITVVGASGGVDDKYNYHSKVSDHHFQIAQHLGLQIECVGDTRRVVVAIAILVIVVRWPVSGWYGCVFRCGEIHCGREKDWCRGVLDLVIVCSEYSRFQLCGDCCGRPSVRLRVVGIVVVVVR